MSINSLTKMIGNAQNWSEKKHNFVGTESKQEEPPSSDQHEGVTTINQLYTKKAVQQITASFQQSQQ